MRASRRISTALSASTFRRNGNTLAIKTFGHDHRWGSVVEGAKTKALHHLSFGCYADDLPRLKARIEGNGVKLIDPPPGFESNGFWFRNHENVLIEIKVGPKVSPDKKSDSQWLPAPAGVAGATIRANSPPVRPRRLSHVLIFTRDIDASIEFYGRNLGLRLSDRAADIVAFMHGIHGSDHHLLALVKSSAPGFHHCSGMSPASTISGSAPCAWPTRASPRAGGSAATCSAPTISTMCAIRGAASRNIPATSTTSRRKTAGRPPTTSRRNSFYLWGPEVPREFTVNYEGGEARAHVHSLAPPSSTFSPGFTHTVIFASPSRPEPVERAEAFEPVIGDRHAAGQPLDRVVRADGDDLQMQRFDFGAFLQAHAAETCNRLAERAVDLRGHVLGREDEAIDVAAETHGEQAE